MDIITYALSKKGIIRIDGKEYKPTVNTDGQVVYERIILPGEYTTFTVGEAGELKIANASNASIEELYINNIPQELPVGTEYYEATNYNVKTNDIIRIKGKFCLPNTGLRITNIILQNDLTNCNYMFAGCTGLTEAPVIPEGVTSCQNMFVCCTNLTEAPVIPSSVTTCDYMFQSCIGLTKAPEIPSSVISCSWMFQRCESLTEAPIIPANVMDCSYMFQGCVSLTTIPQANINLMDNPPATLVIYGDCYSDCTHIVNPISYDEIPQAWGGNKVEEKPGEYTTFTVGEAGELCLLSVDTNPITELYINNVVQELPIEGNPALVSYGTKYLVNLGDIVKIKGGFTLGETTLVINNIVLQNNLTSCSYMFQKCGALTEAPIIPNSVTDCSYMFYKCTSLTEVPVIPEGVTNCSAMFSGCSALTEAPIIPEGVTNCLGMFQNCKKLTEAPVIPEGVTSCYAMFSGCSALTEAPIIPNSVTDCSYMFSGCSALTEAPVIPEGVQICYTMFSGCSLTEAPVIPEGVTDCGYMFNSCMKLTTLPPENVELLSNYPSFLNHKRCYFNCVNIINPISYDEIPDDWK